MTRMDKLIHHIENLLPGIKTTLIQCSALCFYGKQKLV